jgi:hypothetical protein
MGCELDGQGTGVLFLAEARDFSVLDSIHTGYGRTQMDTGVKWLGHKADTSSSSI